MNKSALSLLRKVSQSPIVALLLAASFPAISLLAANHNYAGWPDLLRPLTISILLAIVLYALMNGVMGSGFKAGLMAVLVVLTILSYGHMYEAVKNGAVAGVVIGRHRVLAPALGIGLVLVYLWLRRITSPGAGGTQALNLTALLLIVFPIGQLVAHSARTAFWSSETPAQTEFQEIVRLEPVDNPPDVYFILLDSYTRQDVLATNYDFDNRPFLQELEALGFEVADRSRSNYALTLPSLASTLNMDYLDALEPSPLGADDGYYRAKYLIDENRVVRLFRSLGYTFVAFESAVNYTDFREADVYLPAQALGFSNLRLISGLNGFEALFLRTTIVRLLVDATQVFETQLGDALQDPYRLHRQRVLNILDNLPAVAELEGPKFVFAHVMAPHPPYIFGPQGEPIYSDETFTLTLDLAEGRGEDFQRGYRYQVEFLNARLLEILPQVIARSSAPPIIILAGDHGGFLASHTDRMAILNSYWLPGDGEAAVYEQITPVNTFRLIFNLYFGGDYPLLEDLSFYSPSSDPFVLEPVNP